MDALLKKSKEVLLDCCLPNGAIIAANSDRPDYPHTVQSYRYVWPRDAAYICQALDILGCADEQLAFFRWLPRAEGLMETGLLFQNYYTNGRKRWLALQPDQNGTVLWALCSFISKHPGQRDELMPLAKLLADGICSIWDRDHFSSVTQDLWEEGYTYPEMKSTFTYSLAACARGLICAHELLADDRHRSVAEEMKAKINASFEKVFLRRTGIRDDRRPDISVLGLVWPFAIVPADDRRIRNTVDMLHKELEEDGLFYRAKYDDYDSFRYQGTDGRRGAGTWPIAGFWMAKYYQALGNPNRAEKIISAILKRLDSHMNIPEQMFSNQIQASVKPLAWSHAMYVSCLGNADASPSYQH